MAAPARIIADVEAVPCKVAGPPRRPPADGQLASPAHWRIVCIGYVWLDEDLNTIKIGCCAGDERDILERFMGGLEKARPLIVGCNFRGYDAGVLLARCFHHGIRFPFNYRGGDLFYRYATTRMRDELDVLSGFGASKTSSVDAFAKLAGFPGKVGMDGGDVERLVAEGNIGAVCKYGTSDACQETGIHLRSELIHGLPLDHYRRAGESLLRAIEAHPDVAPLAAMVDRDAFLLRRPAPAATETAA